jgi:ATP-dependent RNA helicase DHX8/PRP22
MSREIVTPHADLPIFLEKKNILSILQNEQFLIISGETGCGKSTQIPKFLYQHLFSLDKRDKVQGLPFSDGIIGVTQPRRVGAVSLARRVAEELGVELGEEVGYTVRFDDRSRENKTKIRFMTDGVLLRECASDPLLRKYSVIIIDEAHERSLQTDILLGLLRDLALNKRPDLRVIVTSATLDVHKFSNFFSSGNSLASKVIHVPGRLHDVNIVYSNDISSLRLKYYVDASVDAALEIHRTQPQGDVLVFLPGQDDIDKACKALGDKIDVLIEDGVDFKFDVVILPVYSALPRDLQYRIFQAAPPNCRKILFATNICETSLTVDGIVYVIDPGLVKQKKFSPSGGHASVDSLLVVPISKVAATQRAGRAGRTQHGICWRLYSQKVYENDLSDETVPEIQRSNLSSTMLLLKEIGVKDPFKFCFLDPPSPQLIADALIHLYQLDALDCDGSLTEIGHRLCKFPLNPSLSKLILLSLEYSCLDEILTIAAMLSSENIWSFGPVNELDKHVIDDYKRKFASVYGDHISLLFIYDEWKSHNCASNWAEKNSLSIRGLKNAKNVRDQLVDIVEELKRRDSKVSKTRVATFESDSVTRARKAIAESFFIQSAHLVGEKGYRAWGSPASVANTFYIHPSSVLGFSEELPKWVIYDEVVFTSKPFMRNVCVIEFDWIKRLMPRLTNVNLKRLTGYTAHELFTASEEQPNLPSSDSVSEKAAHAVSKRRHSEDQISDARERYLARKNQKQKTK